MNEFRPTLCWEDTGSPVQTDFPYAPLFQRPPCTPGAHSFISEVRSDTDADVVELIPVSTHTHTHTHRQFRTESKNYFILSFSLNRKKN